MGKLDGKIALITGGNSGIGLATAKWFAKECAYVFITGRRDSELAAAVKEIGHDVTGAQGDVSNLDDLDRLLVACLALLLIDAEAAEVAGNCPAADTELDAAVTDNVESRDLFGNAQRMRQRQQYDRDAEAQRAGPLGQRREHQQGRRHNREVGIEVLLDRPYGIKTEGLGMHSLIESVAISLDR